LKRIAKTDTIIKTCIEGFHMSGCKLCPRECNVDRGKGELGFCGCGDKIQIARAALHLWEEPCISGEKGSGTIFFSGCNLRCVFCQNYDISHQLKGRTVGEDELINIILDLQDKGATNINLVTPSHFSDKLLPVLRQVKPQLHIPVVYNCGGYESVDTLLSLEGYIDIYMPDFKYMSGELSERYSKAYNYSEVATKALSEMYRQTGVVAYDKKGYMQKGVLIRHLCIPSCRKDSMAVLSHIAETLPVENIIISIMSQYTPDFVPFDCEYENLKRRLTSFEYRSVCDFANKLGFVGYTQDRGSASAAYTPEF
jgi:putative pyruvate formate lyase activating enzyme